MLRTILAVAELRLREGSSARLVLLVPFCFLIGLGVALWAPGAELAQRAALGDRVALGAVGALALLAAVVPAALGMPGDIRTGAANALLAAPLSRFAAVLGGAFGYGTLATLLLIGSAGAALLGLEAGGLGAGAREPVRTYRAATAIAPVDGSVFVSREAPTGRFRFAAPPGAIAEGEVTVRLDPRPRYEGGTLSRVSSCRLSIGRRGVGDGVEHTVRFGPGTPFSARLPLPDALPGEDLELTVRRGDGGWGLLFPADSVEVAGGPRLFLGTVLTACMCLAPLLFVAAAAAGLGAARFGAPTALGLALFLLVLFASQDILRDGAEFVLRAAETAAETELPPGHSADDGHEHHDEQGRVTEVSALQIVLARATLAGLRVFPPLDTFDRTGDLLARRAVRGERVGHAVLSALFPFLALILIGWALFARRELVPT